MKMIIKVANKYFLQEKICIKINIHNNKILCVLMKYQINNAVIFHKIKISNLLIIIIVWKMTKIIYI